jgi:hypothetical protein
LNDTRLRDIGSVRLSLWNEMTRIYSLLLTFRSAAFRVVVDVNVDVDVIVSLCLSPLIHNLFKTFF